ncbi:MAG: hypothetical protein P1U37_13070 [Minwuia sp.]|nr:hypothetical protein [Minwuia sp.]
MRTYIARRALRAFGKHYDYDVSYLEHLLRISPRGFFGFRPVMALARHREAVPRDAASAARLVGAMHEDCGPCLQITTDMAREAGMEDDQIDAVLTGAGSRMSSDTALGYQFATALVGRTADLDTAREAVRAAHGERAVVDLTFATQIGRIFPMIKTGLGFGQACQRIQLGSRVIDMHRKVA